MPWAQLLSFEVAPLRFRPINCRLQLVGVQIVVVLAQPLAQAPDAGGEFEQLRGHLARRPFLSLDMRPVGGLEFPPRGLAGCVKSSFTPRW
jgi:hypothetical protein